MIRHCTGCKHFNFDEGWGGTDVTPGYSAYFSCCHPDDKVGFPLTGKLRPPAKCAQPWEFDSLYELCQSAESCPGFEPAEYNK